MDLLWPDFLLLLGFIPVLIALYVWVLRRRSRFAIRYSSLLLVQDALPRSSWLRRHLPFILFIAALTSLTVALARPIAPQAILTGRTTIMLTLDISRSMCMQDIPPNRLTAAKSAALSFIEHPVLGTQIGIVAFSGFAELVQKPTTEQSLLENAIGNLTTATQTAIGSAILRSLDAIAEVDKRVAMSEAITTHSSPSAKTLSQTRSLHEGYVPHIIVLLTDGASNTGPAPLSAAQEAAERGVRIYSIGFGTTQSAIMDCWNLAGDPSSSSGVQAPTGQNFGSGPDEATLKQIAEITGGKFYSATSAAQLQNVFQNLRTTIATTNKPVEVSAYFSALGVILAIAALSLSILWHPLL